MEGFFYIARRDAPEIIDTLASRYGWTIRQIEEVDITTLADVLKTAIEKNRRDTIYEEWVALHPYMVLKWLKFMRFDEYYDARTGANMDMRPAAEILAEVEEIRKELG